MLEDTPGVGNMITGSSDDLSLSEVLHPSGASGQALIVAGVGLLILYLTVGRQSGGGFVQRAGAVAQWVLILGSGMVVVNYLGRHFAGLHPNAPGAGGIIIDL